MIRYAGVAHVVVLAMLPLLLSVVTPASFAGQPDTKRIAFLSDRESVKRAFNLFLLDLENLTSINLTAGLKNLTIRSTSHPRFHKNRNSLIFIAFQPQSFAELSLDTRQIRRIVDVSYEATEYDVAPDGKALLYTEKVDTSLQLFEVDLDTGAKQNLTRNVHNNTEPSYSHDGRSIVYVCDSDGSRSIAIMNRDGTGHRILTNPFGEDRFPRFSPDDRRVVFSSSRSAVHEGDLHLYFVDREGTNLRLFHRTDAFNDHPLWSPDTSCVAYISNQRGSLYRDVFLKNLRTGAVRQVTKDLKYFNGNLEFSRDGGYLVFENAGPANAEIMMYDMHTGVLRNVTNSKSRDLAPTLIW